MSAENNCPKSRKRLRRPNFHKEFVRKQKVQKGHEHFSRSGKLIPARIFTAQDVCKCNKKCAEKIDVQRQYEIFQTYYYQFNSWTSKTLFLRGCMKRHDIVNKASDQCPILPIKNRTLKYTYTLLDANGVAHHVCKKFFSKCLKIDPNQANRAFESITTNPSAIDRRGKATPTTKTKLNDELYVKQFINKFPRYISHYNRKNSDKYYLAPNLNIRRMYIEYKLVCELYKRTVVSEYVFRDIFNTKFNLHFKRPKTDTCKTCDQINASLKNDTLSFKAKKEKEEMKKEHLICVEKKNLQFKADVDEAKKSNGEIKCYTFDLQKTLETPSLSTSNAYYKRQLWTFNCCVYDEITKKGFMYMWSEDIGSRGANEIASCLIKHLTTYADENTKKIYLYSDSCPGQNRNIKTTLLLKKALYLLNYVEIISQKFFVPGHSFNSCDRCFALIERQKTKTTEIFIPKHWQNIVRVAKKTEPKFEVIQMSRNDFYSSEILTQLIVNRKVTTNRKKINWFNIDTIINDKKDPFVMYFQEKNCLEIQQINLKKKDNTKEMFINTNLDNIKTKIITKKKYDDLISLLQFIPEKYHNFYINLQYHNDDETDDDYALASDSENDE